MAETLTNGQAEQPQLSLQKLYVRDVSFEAPNAPQVFQDMGRSDAQPQIQLNLNQKAAELGEGAYEVVLTLTLTCTMDSVPCIWPKCSRPAFSASPASIRPTARRSLAPTAPTCCSHTRAR